VSERLIALSTRHKTVLSTLIKAEMVKIERQKEQVTRLFERQTRAVAVLITRRKERLTSLTSLISVLSYKSVLQRGFALVRDDKDRPLQTAGAVKPASRIILEFADGKVEAVAGGVKKAKEKLVQESLF
jgi:exodeoxyribonuclease VII large subunit